MAVTTGKDNTSIVTINYYHHDSMIIIMVSSAIRLVRTNFMSIYTWPNYTNLPWGHWGFTMAQLHWPQVIEKQMGKLQDGESRIIDDFGVPTKKVSETNSFEFSSSWQFKVTILGLVSDHFNG